MVYEANARLRDPVYGCVAAISTLQHQVEVLQAQLAIAQAEMVRLRLWHKIFLAATGETVGSTSAGGAGAAATSPGSKPIFSGDAMMDQALAMDEPLWAHHS